MADNNKATIKIELVKNEKGEARIELDMKGSIEMLGIALQKTIDGLSENPQGQAILRELALRMATEGIINQINSKGGESNNGRN